MTTQRQSIQEAPASNYADQDSYSADLQELIASWEDYWATWLALRDTTVAQARFLRALHDPESRIPKEFQNDWLELEQQGHDLLHLLETTKLSNNRQSDLFHQTVETAISFQRRVRELLLKQQQSLGDLDTVTGLPNRRRLSQDLERELARIQRGAGACVAMIDLDHFKAFNDRHGHLAGDEALAAFAAFLRQSLRPYDGVYRYGGEEFVLLLPGMTGASASQCGSRLCAQLASTQFHLANGTPYALSMSMGITPLSANTSKDTALAQADRALYQAKNTGRNQAIFFPEASEAGRGIVSS